MHSVYTASQSAGDAGTFNAKVPFIGAKIEIKDGKVAGKNRYTVSEAELIRASALLKRYDADSEAFELLSIALRGVPLTPKSVGYLASLRSDGKGETHLDLHSGGLATPISFKKFQTGWCIAKKDKLVLRAAFEGHIQIKEFINGYWLPLPGQMEEGMMSEEQRTVLQKHLPHDLAAPKLIMRDNEGLCLMLEGTAYRIGRRDGKYGIMTLGIPDNEIQRLTFRDGHVMMRVPGGFANVPYSQLGDGCTRRYMPTHMRKQILRRWEGIEIADLPKPGRHAIDHILRRNASPVTGTSVHDGVVHAHVGRRWKPIVVAPQPRA